MTNDTLSKMDSPPLPRASGNVEVHLLNGGSFMADTEKINAGCQNRRFRLYNWAFAIYHKESDRKLIWDLGLVNVRPCCIALLDKELIVVQEPALYPPFIQNALFPDISPTSPRQSIPQQIQTFCKWNQGDVDTVIFRYAPGPLQVLPISDSARTAMRTLITADHARAISLLPKCTLAPARERIAAQITSKMLRANGTGDSLIPPNGPRIGKSCKAPGSSSAPSPTQSTSSATAASG